MYRWHSINLIPMMGCYSISDDQNHIQIIGRAIEITLFGQVIVFTYATKKLGKMWHTSVRGPLWSRRTKQWYRVINDL